MDDHRGQGRAEQGYSLRSVKLYGPLAQAMVVKFRFGYAFELPGNGETTLNYSSHKLMIGMSMAVFSFHDLAQKTF